MEEMALLKRILALFQPRKSGCPICGGRHNRQFREVSSRILLICRRCRHVFFEQMPTAQELDDYYSAQYTGAHEQFETQVAEGQREYYRNHAAELAACTGKALPELSVLDFGSSYPTFAKEAMDEGCRQVVSVDYSREAKEWGDEHGVEVIAPDAMQALPCDSFDVLRYSHVLEHIVDPLSLLQEHIPKLKRGGLVYVGQPSFPVFKYQASDVDPHDCVYPNHLHFFSPLSVMTLAKRIGLRVVDFFTVTDTEIGKQKYSHLVDLEYTKKELQWLDAQQRRTREELCYYPWFTGMNAALYAVKK